MIPYVNILGMFTLWTVAVCMLQSKVNQIARLSPTEWDATQLMLPAPAYYNPAAANGPYLQG